MPSDGSNDGFIKGCYQSSFILYEEVQVSKWKEDNNNNIYFLFITYLVVGKKFYCCLFFVLHFCYCFLCYGCWFMFVFLRLNMAEVALKFFCDINNFILTLLLSALFNCESMVVAARAKFIYIKLCPSIGWWMKM